VGDSYNITWTRYGAVAFVDIYLSTTGGIGGGGSYPPAPFATVPATDLTYVWTIPDSIGKNCRIKSRIKIIILFG